MLLGPASAVARRPRTTGEDLARPGHAPDQEVTRTGVAPGQDLVHAMGGTPTADAVAGGGRCPRSRLRRLRGCGHVAARESQPDQGKGGAGAGAGRRGRGGWLFV